MWISKCKVHAPAWPAVEQQYQVFACFTLVYCLTCRHAASIAEMDLPSLQLQSCAHLSLAVAPEAVWQVWRRHTNLLKFGQLIFVKIIKIVATRCQI